MTCRREVQKSMEPDEFLTATLGEQQRSSQSERHVAVVLSWLFSLSVFVGNFISAEAMDLDWTGTYRMEGYHIVNSELSGKNREKAYGLHHLVLKPKIVAGDGLTIYGRFDLFNNGTYSSGQLGQFFGNGIGATPSTYVDNSNVLSETQSPESLVVSHVYFTYVQEWGALIAGRAPLHFGLGMTHNAGQGEFDHWLDTRDLVGYKLVMGNLYVLPMLGKVSEGASIDTNDDVTDYMVQAAYENPETDLAMGVFYQRREAARAGNDAPADAVFGDTGSVVADQFRAESINVYVKKELEDLTFGAEIGQRNGTSGILNSSSDKVSISGLGVAAEAEWRPSQSPWVFGARFGWASGDNPSTTDSMEGYFFDRNYEVALLMFNHTLGRENFLQSNYVGGGPNVTGVNAQIKTPDVETVTNAGYLAPYVNYAWTDQWQLQGVFATGVLNEVANDGSSAMGFEIDFNLFYRPNERMSWVNQFGYFFPGDAFAGGTSNYDVKPAFGFVTKAAINF